MAWVEKNSTKANQRTFIIQSASDLTNLPECDAGSFAYLEDMTKIWQMGISGSWVQIGGES